MQQFYFYFLAQTSPQFLKNNPTTLHSLETSLNQSCFYLSCVRTISWNPDLPLWMGWRKSLQSVKQILGINQDHRYLVDQQLTICQQKFKNWCINLFLFLQCCIKTWCIYTVLFFRQFGRLKLARGAISLH